MANRNEVKAVADALRTAGHKVAVADSANFYANSIESMFWAEQGRKGGPRADVLMLQSTDHDVPGTLCVLRLSKLEQLLGVNSGE